MTQLTPRVSHRDLTRSIKGVIGSSFFGISACIRRSRIMKLVAAVSSSISSVVAPASSASTMAATLYDDE